MKLLLLTFVCGISAYMLPPQEYGSAKNYGPWMNSMPRGGGDGALIGGNGGVRHYDSDSNSHEDLVGGWAGIRHDDYVPSSGYTGGRGSVRHDNYAPSSNTDVENGLIGGNGGVRHNTKRDTGSMKIGGSAGVRKDNKKFNVATDKIGGAAGIRPDNRGKRSTDVGTGIIGGSAGVRKDNTQNGPSDGSNWILNGGSNVKPWKSAEPRIRGGQDKSVGKRDTGNMKIGGSAGVRKDNKKFNVATDKIGGAAGIRPDNRGKRSTDVATGIIGGSAGVRKDNTQNANNWVLNGGNDVKPWKTFEPKIRGTPLNN